MSSNNLNTLAVYATAISSAGLRVLCYVFLRWIPGHPFPPIILSIAAVYVPAFVYSLSRTEPYDVVSDEIDIVTRDVRPEDDAGDVDPRYTDGKDAADLGQELDVQETVVLREKDPQIVKTLLSGLPSPSSLLWSAVTFAINVALVAMMCDVVYRATLFHPSHELSMARVGYVSESAAKILVREPDASKLPVFISFRKSALHGTGLAGSAPYEGAWKAGGRLDQLDDSTDFTGTVELRGLDADTRYQYTASNHTGWFTTAPRVGQLSNIAPGAGTFTFLASSCLKNNLPYNPFAHPLRNQGLQHLSRALEGLQARFMLFLGDFIYIDVPRRHGATVEDHRREYRQVYSSPDWAGATRELPWVHVYDDHEIGNDWDGNTTGPFAAANDPYTHYHTSVNPPRARPGETYFAFTHGPAAFFVLDTRRYRSPNDASNGSDPATGRPTKSMLGPRQLADLLAWLRRPPPAGVRWKVVVSSVPFTRNWWVNAQDTWRGYMGERQVVLEAMWDVGLRGGVGVVVLSGDRHEFAATAFPPPPDGKEEEGDEEVVGAGVLRRRRRKIWPLSATVHEFSASPLNMFYLPFRTYAEPSPSSSSASSSTEHVSDVCIKYIPDGNSKFGAVSIRSPPTSDQSILHYRLFVDGVEKWSYTITTPPDVGGGGRAKDAIWG